MKESFILPVSILATKLWHEQVARRKRKKPSKIMKRARTDDEPTKGGGDGGKILLIKYTDCGSDVYSLDSVTPLAYSYLQTANDKHAEDIDDGEDEDFDNNVSPLNMALCYIWRAIGFSVSDKTLNRMCPELRESTEKVDFGAWNEYKTTYEDVNAGTISKVFTVNCSDI